MSSLSKTEGQSNTRVEPAAHKICVLSTVWRWTTTLLSLISVSPNVKYGLKLWCEVTVISCWILNVITYHLIQADIYGKRCLDEHQSDLWPPYSNQFLYADVCANFRETPRGGPEITRSQEWDGRTGRQPEHTVPLGTTIAVKRHENIWCSHYQWR